MSEPMLREFLDDRDTPCPSCGYNLRGLTGSACPECSQGLVLQVGLAEPRLGAYLAAVIGTALGAGFSGLILLYVGIRMFGGRGGGPPGEVLMYCGLPTLVQGGVLALLLRSRRWFRRRSTGTQWLLAVGCVLLTLANVLVFSYNVN